MKRDFLKELNIDEENINKIMAEYGKSVESIKSENAELKTKEAEFKATQEQLDKLQGDLKTLETSEATIEELREQLKAKDGEFESFKADSEKREIDRTKVAGLTKLFKDAGALEEAIDLLIPTIDLEVVQLDKSNAVVDGADLVNQHKESRKGLFVQKQLDNNPPPKNNGGTLDDLDDQAFFNSMMKGD